MLRNVLLLFSCVVVVVSFDSCKEKLPPVEQVPSPAAEYAQIPLIDNLTKQIGVDGTDPDLYYERGAAYAELGNKQQAIADVTKAIQLDSANAGYYELLGDIYYQNKEYVRAMDILQKGNKIIPGDTALLLRLARYNLMAGSKQESIKLLDEVLQKNVFNAEAYYLKGMVFKQIGDTAKSISNFQTAVEQEPRYYEAYMQLGLLFSGKKDKLALDYLNNALKIDSSSYEAKYAIAMYYQEVKDYDKALEMYRGFILNFPQDKEAYYNTGYIYFQMDSIQKAIRSFERAIGVEPTYADAFYMRGLCAEAIKDFKTAKYYYQQTLNLNPKHELATNGFKRMEQIKEGSAKR